MLIWEKKCAGVQGKHLPSPCKLLEGQGATGVCFPPEEPFCSSIKTPGTLIYPCPLVLRAGMAWCGHVWYQLSLEKTIHVLPISLSTISATYAALPGFDCCFLSSGIILISTMLLPSWCHSLIAMKGCVSPSMTLPWHDGCCCPMVGWDP